MTNFSKVIPNQLILLKAYSILLLEASRFFPTDKFVELHPLILNSYNKLYAMLEIGDDLIISELEQLLEEIDRLIEFVALEFLPVIEKANNHYKKLTEEYHLLLDTLETFKDNCPIHIEEIANYEYTAKFIKKDIENHPSVFREVKYLEQVVDNLYCLFSEHNLFKTIQSSKKEVQIRSISTKSKVVNLFNKQE